MNKIDFDSYIEQCDKENKAEIRAKTEQKLGINLSQSNQAVKTSAFNNFIPVVCVLVCVVCFAVFLSVFLKKDKPETVYYTNGDYQTVRLDTELKNYDGLGKKPLYINEYNVAAEVVTNAYVDKKRNDKIVFLSETFAYDDSLCFKALYVCDAKTRVKELEILRDMCVENTVIQNIKAKWYCCETFGVIAFESDGLKYILKIDSLFSKDDVFNTVKSMLNKKELIFYDEKICSGYCAYCLFCKRCWRLRQ